ncbi:class I SAM-dependent methyltransferase [Methanolobus sp.]|uniref:class I SAM-dependent methyltransferase n=1 Tax=Methanolobus sp. TaxID=1874737 RepID=UPI0025D360F6|nr:class I SAM-dependent methyltransferase [Methanolobus sp.]
MSPAHPYNNDTPYLPEDFDARVVSTIPYYQAFHREVINLVRALPFKPDVWLDTGCGTGALVHKAAEEFPDTRFLLMDPSEGMLEQAKIKLSSLPREQLVFLEPSPTQGFSGITGERPDIITAIQCHHYLSREERVEAIDVCYRLLKDDGIFITFENIRPFTDSGIAIGKNYVRNFQLSLGKEPGDIEKNLARFDVEYFPITVEEHLKLLREAGFKVVELLWYSYMQAGFYCIR